MEAKKSFGQHFLTNELIADRIANALIRENEYAKVLEVGPGKGFLTKYLLKKDYELFAVEADKDMVTYLNEHYPELSSHIISQDFLKLDFESIFGKEPFAIIGNFPYNISTQIVFKMIENREQIPEMVGMFQKEVAERIVSGPGGKEYGVISVLTQAFYEGKYLFTVDKGNFNPPPKVQSGVIRLSRKSNLELGCKPELFRTIVKTTFGQRRKMIRNTMKSFLTSAELLADPFFNQRPEVLSVADFIQLTKWVEEKR
ncbi:MAG: 16S rRNA (adenine(1518)-N(6)/adenine(1519)-N(6))-dimethyltransferase RsmA [Saprospiraceae bacterium]